MSQFKGESSMGESVAFVRFVGLEISDDVYASLTGDGDEFIHELDGLKFVIHSSTMGDAPHWLLLTTAKSICRFSYSHWDGHGGGAEDFDYTADPFTKVTQAAANAHDTMQLQQLAIALLKHGMKPGKVQLVLGWTDTLKDTSWDGKKMFEYPKVHESEVVVSYGPWRLGNEDPTHSDDDITTAWWTQYTTNPLATVELPYGKVTVPGYPAIPIRTKAESEKLLQEADAIREAATMASHPEWFNADGTRKF
jgi:hypothetical protein